MFKNRISISALNVNSTRANILWAFALQTIEKIAGYLVLVVLTRTLLKEELGLMFLASTISELCATLLTFGTDSYLVRSIATDRPQALSYLSRVLSTRLVNALLMFAGLNLGFMLFAPRLGRVLLLVSAFDFLEEIYFSFSAFFAGQRRLLFRLIVSGGFEFLTLAGVSLVAIYTHSLFPVLWTYFLIDLALLVVVFWVVRRFFGIVRFQWSLQDSLSLMRVSASFFVLNFLTLVHMRFDTVLVGLFLDLRQVANYELGIKFVEVTRFIVRPVNTVFLPVFSEYAARDQWPKLRLRFVQLMILTFGAGLALFIGMQAFGSGLIVWLFGASYLESVAPTKILFLSVPFMYVSFLATVLATSMHLEKQSAFALGACVALNLGLNVLLIPALGTIGAAWATVISQTLLVVLMLALVALRLKRQPRLPPPEAGAEDLI